MLSRNFYKWVCVCQTIVKCEASTSQPRAEEVEINGYACFETIEEWQWYVSFFWGREKNELEPIQRSIAFDECKAMIEGNYDLTFGKLIPDETGNIMRTQNKWKIRYAWNQNLAEATQNRVLMKITLIYNFHDDEMFSSLSMMPGCAIRKGFCNVDKYTYIWDAKKVPVCDSAPFCNRTVNIHTDKQGKVMNIRIPELGLAYNHLTQCPTYVMNCATKINKILKIFIVLQKGWYFIPQTVTN